MADSETVTLNVALRDNASKGLRQVQNELDKTTAATEKVSEASDSKNFKYDDTAKDVGALQKALDGAAGSSRTMEAAQGRSSKTMSAVKTAVSGFKTELGNAIREEGNMTGKLSVMGVAAEAAKKRSLNAFYQLGVGIRKTVQGIKPTFSGIVDGAKNAVRRTGAALKSGLKGLATGVVAGAGAALGVALTKGFSRLDKIDQAQAKLRGLGNNAGSVAKIMENATASVTGTAFGLDEAATTAAGAVAAGIKPGTELEGVLKTVSNSASATGSSMSEMGSIFNKVAATGKAQTDSFNMLADRGLPVWSALSEQVGLTGKDLSKFVASGGVDFKTFAAVAKSSAGTVAKEMGTTMSGTFKNLNAAMGRIGATILAPFTSSAPRIITAVTGILDRVNEALGPFMEGVGKKLAPVADKIATVLESVAKNGLGGLGDSIKQFMPVLAPLIGAFAALGTSGLSGLVGKMGALGGVVSKLLPVFNPWVGAIIGLVAASPELQGVLGGLVTQLGGGLMSVLQQVAPLVVSLAQTLGGALQQALKVVAPAVTVLLQAVVPIVGTLMQVGVGIVQALIPAVQAILQALGPVLQVVGVIVKALAPVLKVVGVLVAGIVKVLAAILIPIIKVLAVVIAGVFNGLGAVISGFVPFFTGVWNGVVGVVRGVIGWFQNSVLPVFTAVWNGIVTAARWAFNNVLKPIWTGVKIAFLLVATAIGLYWQTVLKPVFTAVAAVARWLWANALRPAFNGIKTGWHVLVTAFQLYWQTVLKPVFNAVATVARWLWHNVAVPAFSGIKAAFRAVGTGIAAVWNTVIHPALRAVGRVIGWLHVTIWRPAVNGIKAAWSGLGTGLRAVKNNVIDPVFRALKSGVRAVQTAFEHVRDGIARAWGALKEKVAAPVRFIVNTVYNDKIRGVWNGIASKVGMKNLQLPERKFAQGGVMPGYTPGRDVHHFTSPTGGNLHLSGGEAIMRPEFTKAVGGAVGIAQLNTAARRGGSRGLNAYMRYGGEDSSQFKKGGVWGAGQNGGVQSPAVDKAKAWAQSQVGKPYIWGGVGPRGYDCSGFMSAITNVITGRSPYHRLFATASFSRNRGAAGFVPGITGSAFSLGVSPNTGSGIGHTAGTLGGMNVESYGHHGPATGSGARGADNGLFPWKFHLPQVGGQFVSGGSGGGGASQPLFDINPLKKLKDLFNQIPGAGNFSQMLAAGGRKLVDGMVKKVMPFAGGVATAGQAVSRWVSGAKAMAVRAKGLAWAAANGMSPGDIKAMDFIIQHESGWNNNSTGGPGSSASGLPQFLTMQCNEQGFSPPLSKYSMEFQLAAMKKYVMGRFHSWGNALAFWKSHRWYSQGGVVPNGLGVYDNGGPLPHGAAGINLSGRSEYVLSADQSDLLTSGLRTMTAAPAGASMHVGTIKIDIHGDVYGVDDLEDRMEAAAEDTIERIFKEFEERR